MPRNIEIKARIPDLSQLAEKVAAIADAGPFAIAQDDTFFRCDTGRLKLLRFADGTGELIFYRRADQPGPRESFYIRSPVSAADALRESLSLAYGVTGRVRKQRRLFMIGRTCVLADGEPAAAGVTEAKNVMAKLDVDQSQLLDRAYVDLLQGK